MNFEKDSEEFAVQVASQWLAESESMDELYRRANLIQDLQFRMELYRRAQGS